MSIEEFTKSMEALKATYGEEAFERAALLAKAIIEREAGKMPPAPKFPSGTSSAPSGMGIVGKTGKEVFIRPRLPE